MTIYRENLKNGDTFGHYGERGIFLDGTAWIIEGDSHRPATDAELAKSDPTWRFVVTDAMLRLLDGTPYGGMQSAARDYKARVTQQALPTEIFSVIEIGAPDYVGRLILSPRFGNPLASEGIKWRELDGDDVGFYRVPPSTFKVLRVGAV